MGKHKPDYSRHLLTGDFVIVVNAAKVEVTGNQSALKTYYRHSGYVGNLKATPMRTLLSERPNRVIERTVKGMLPRNRLGRKMLRRLRVYLDATHPHLSQVSAGTGKSKRDAGLSSSRVPPEEEASIAKRPTSRSVDANPRRSRASAAVGSDRTASGSNDRPPVSRRRGQTGGKRQTS